MMKTFKYWMLFGLSLCASVAFARKGYVEQNIPVTSFDQLEISGFYRATLEPSDKYEIVIEIPESVKAYAQTKVSDKKVKLFFDMERMSRSERQYMSEHRPYVSIKAPSFYKLELSGATSMDMKGAFNLDEVRLTLSGASNFNAARFKAKKLTMDVSGACNISVQDLVANHLKMDISGACNINVRDLVADNLKMDISGASRCKHSAIEVENMKVDLSGNSYLEMKAFANYADVDVSGLSCCDWEPLNGKVGERLDVEVSGLSKMYARDIRYRNIYKEVCGMSKLKIGKESR